MGTFLSVVAASIELGKGGRQNKEKAKVVIAVWGTEFIQFLAALAILHQKQSSSDDLCFLFCINPSSMV